MIPDIPAIVLLHGACATVYAVLAAMVLARPPISRTGALLVFACAATAVWAATFALSWQFPLARLVEWLEVGRAAAWYAFILHLYRRSVAANEQIAAAFKTMGLLALLMIVCAPLVEWVAGPASPSFQSFTTALRLGIAVCNVLLLENLYFNTPPESRWHINLLCVALGGMFLYDLVLYADGVLFHRLSFALVEGRAPAIILAAPLIAVAAVRDRRWAVDIHVSRDVVFHTFTLIGSGIFLLAIALIGEVFRHVGSEWGSVAETSLIFAAILAVAVTLTSGSARSRIKSIVVENFFSNRYDYRREWMRCIDALTAPDAFVALHKRGIRAAAEVVDSPAGALFVRPPRDVAFQWAGSWNMPAVTAPVPPGHPLVALFRDGDWIVRLEEHADAESWFPELPRSWVVLPLNHFGDLIGFIVLARSRAQFKLDREAYDLLRVVGREIASRVAEQRAMQVLTQTQQLREYSQRFAFVIHDIKNVSGQLSMLLTNAEVYADNPEFQRDMLATVRASVGKITRLLSRLQAERQERDHALITPAERLRDVIDAARMTSRRHIVFQDHGTTAGAAIDPDSFDAVVTHLLNNALEASEADTSVEVDLRVEAAGVVVDIIDHGPGMPPEFVRDELFRPLRTTKGDGHGIGAFQARELLRDAGGDLLVISKPQVGTTMRLILPSVRPGVAEPASPTHEQHRDVQPKLLIVEDDEGLCSQYRWAFPACDILMAHARAPAVTMVKRENPPVAIMDLGLPPDPDGVSEGFATLSEILRIAPQTKVIVVTGNGERKNALRAVALGAYDFCEKPVEIEVLRTIIERGLNLHRLEEENRRMAAVPVRSPIERIITGNQDMLKVCRDIEKIATTNVPVLLLGESGTGKEALARAVHDLGPRAKQPFVAINCGAIPENLLESELFGHERGAFTGAVKQTIGKIENANKGTLFLDEIGDLPHPLQVKLLRFLQDQIVERIGGRQKIQVDVRIVSATNANLDEKIGQGVFRGDLFYRMNAFTIRIPPLRDRGADIVLLANYFLNKFNQEFSRGIRGFTEHATAAMNAHEWPGNVRELENRMKRAVVMAERRLIDAADLELAPPPEEFPDLDLRTARLRAERDVIQEALMRSNNTLSVAARLLGVSRPTLYGLMEAHGFATEAARSNDGSAAPAEATMKSD